MALSLKDRVRESSSTTGTGTITLAGAYVGFQTFASVISDGDTVYYTIHNTAPGYETEWEVGLGTFTASGTTLSRDTILSSSNSGSAVNFSAGTKEVFITQPAEKAVFEDGSNNVTVGGKLTVGTGPTADLDVATKAYVDNATAAALHYHDPVRVESPSALTVTYNNGTAGVGATLTNAGTQVALVIDGITLNVADRVLIYTQTAAAQNGVYTVTDVGSGSTNWVLTRATDADSYSPSDPDSLGQGDAFYVKEGDTGAGESYVLTTQGTITFGTTAITFSQFAAAPQPGNGTLTMNVSGTGLSGSQTFTANQTSNATFTVTSNATSSNTNSTIVARDASGNFSAGTVTASLTGNVTGNLTGNVTGNADTATTATNVKLTNTSTSASFYIPFASGNSTGNYGLGVDAGLYYNPSLNSLNVTEIGVVSGYWSGSFGPFDGSGTSSYLSFGNSYDTKMFYDGTNNTMEMELEGAAGSFIITDNGTTRFTFTKATGNLTATSFTGALTGNVTGNVTGNLTGNVTGNADTATSATTAGSVTNSITFNNGGAGGASGTTYNGGTAPTISYNTIGAPSVSGTNATGTWGISVSGNAATATALQTARTIGGVSFDGTANINLPGVNTTGNQNTSGNAASATTVNATVTGTTSADLVTGEMAGSDYFRVRIGGTASDAGFVELATADNGNEPIYVRQYSLSGADPWGTLTRSATLLDASGNTSFPGTVTAPTFSGALSGNASTATTATTANALNTGNNYQVNSLGVGTAGSGTAGEIRATNQIVAYYSDDRLKTKLGTIENALDKIDSLAGFYYEANQTAQDLGYGVKREVGVSAQSVQAVMPEVVSPAPIDEKYLTVQYERLVPLLIEGIKELRAEIKALKGE